MIDTSSSWLARDHRRLGALLDSAIEGDAEASAKLRAGLLRHIGIEEKILLRGAVGGPSGARRCRAAAPPRSLGTGGAARALADALTARARASAARASRSARGDPGGLYAIADEVLTARHEGLIARFAAAPEPPVAKHFDGPRAFAAIEELLARAAAAWSA